MKVAAFNGSGRKDGNTAILIECVLRKLNDAGIQTEMVQLAGKPLRGCTACGWCINNKVGRCTIEDDDLNSHLKKMIAADGIILGSPTYFADVSSETKALIDRAGFVSMANGGLLARKVGVAVIAARRGGAVHAFDTINHFFLVNQMIIPGSRYWNFGIGRGIGEVRDDEEGMLTMDTLGENMAWLMKKIGH